MTLNKLIELYLDITRHLLDISTQNKYRSYCKFYVEKAIGTMPISKIKPVDVQEFFNLLLDKKEASGERENETASCGSGLSPNTVKVIRNALKAAFKHAVENNFLTENPVLATKLPPIKKSSATSMTVAEANAFAQAKNDFWYGDAFVFQLHTGLRNQEVMALIWDDIDFDKRIVRVERACKWIRGTCVAIGRPKTEGSTRFVTLSNDVIDLLQLHYEKQQKHIEEYIKQHGEYGDDKIDEWIEKYRLKSEGLYIKKNLIFPQRNGTVPAISVARKEFKEMVQSAGVINAERNFRWYDLRHSHASILLITDTIKHEVAKRMGHSEGVLDSTYTHSLADREHRAAEAFAALVSTGGNKSSAQRLQESSVVKKPIKSKVRKAK